MATIMQTVSKSQLKSQLLEYLRKVEKSKKPLIITHLGEPVIKIFPYREDSNKIFNSLKGSIVFHKDYDPAEPIGEKEWDALK